MRVVGQTLAADIAGHCWSLAKFRMVGLCFGGAERSPRVWTLLLKKAEEENAAFPRSCVG